MIFLSKDNVLLLLWYDMGGGESAVWGGRPENLKIRSVKLSCKFATGGWGVHQFYPGKIWLLLISVFGICIYIYGIPVHVAVKVICLTIHLVIFLSKDNVLLLLWYDMGGSICLRYLHVFSMHWYFLISSYYLTVSLYLPIIWLFRMGAHWPH